MNPRRTLSALFWATIAIQTLGNIDAAPMKKKDFNPDGSPKHLRRKLPPPRAYVAPVVLYAVLGWVSQLSDNLARASVGLGGLILTTSLFVNARGKGGFSAAGERVTNFFNLVAEKFGPPAGQQGGAEFQPIPPTEGEMV
jgi:hypothetical protein